MRDAADLIVDAQWLNGHLGEGDLRVVDTRTPDLYMEGHVPGAVNLNIFELHWWDTSPGGLPGFRDQHTAAMGAIGISREDTVVFYDDRSGMLASRGVWAFEVLGQHRVALLDGGLGAWLESGLPVETDPTVLPAVKYEPTWHPESLAGVNDTLAAIPDHQTFILDARAREEYEGSKVRAKHAGAVPGAVHCDYERNLDTNGQFKSAEELTAMYEGLGLQKDSPIVTYCHGGYRSANAYIALRLAGYSNVRNYFGSWGEWGNRDDVPHEIPAGE